MKKLILAAIVLLSFALQAQPVIRTGGTITGKTYVAPNATTDALQISCYDLVTFRNCKFKGQIRYYGGGYAAFINCTFDSVKATGADINPRALDMYQPQNLLIDSCTFTQTAGIRVDHRNENTKSVIIRNSRFINTDSRNGYGQFVEGQQRAAILIDGCVGLVGGIGKNYFYNELFKSCIEDNINLRNSGGLPGRYFPIDSNYIDGAYRLGLDYQNPPSVSGITVESADIIGSDAEKAAQAAQWVSITGNRIVRTGNGGINLTSCHDVYSTGNTVISSGKYPDGRSSFAFWGALGMWDGYNVGANVMKNVSQKKNTLGYVRPGITNGGTDRQDWVVTPGSPISIAAGDNTSLPNPITKATEDAQYHLWLKDIGGKASDNTAAVTLNQYDSLLVSATPLDTAKQPARYTAGTFRFSSSDSSILTVVQTTTETKAKLIARKAGRVSVTGSLTTERGNPFQKAFEVEVLYLYPEPVDMAFTFSKPGQ